MWLMATNRIPATGFSPFAEYPLFHPPAYPFFLAALFETLGSTRPILYVQTLVGSLLIPAVGRIAALAFGKRAGVIAAALTAFWPELIWYGAHFWCETLFLAALWGSIERLVTAHADGASRPPAFVVAGALWGMAVLIRETVLYLAPFVALWLLATRRKSAVSAPASPSVAAAGFLAGVILVVGPWTARNYAVFREFIPVATGGALNLYQGNAPLSRGQVYAEYYTNEGRVEQYLWARREGLRVIRDRQPAWIFEKLRDELPRLFEADSLALIHIRRGAYDGSTCSAYRASATIVLLPWLGLVPVALVGVSRLRREPVGALLTALIVLYSLLHVATHGFSRYRLPILPALMILAATLVGRAWDEDPPSRMSRVVAGLLIAAFVVISVPSIVDQFGYFGWATLPSHEGFKPVCP